MTPKTVTIGAVLLVAASVALAGSALARVYVCDVLHAYDADSGELVISRYGNTSDTIVLDDDTGIFKYGLKGQWTEERMRIMSKGSDGWSAAGYYMHNDTIFIAIRVLASDPPSFIWMDVFQVYTGTCKVYGN